MTSMAGCREIRHTLGVYVLGAIDPAERALVEEHLATCLDCREELAALAGLPALLRRIPVEEAERLAMADSGAADDLPSDELLGRLLDRGAAVKRARRWRGIAVAAAVAALAMGGGAAVSNALQPASQLAPAQVAQQPLRHAWQTVSATNPKTGAVLTVKYATMAWGTMINVQVKGLRTGITCQFQVTDSAGRHWVVGGWRLTHRHGYPWYPASTAIGEKNLRSFELTSGGTVLAQVQAS
jgi:Putative zinc-finger